MWIVVKPEPDGGRCELRVSEQSHSGRHDRVHVLFRGSVAWAGRELQTGGLWFNSAEARSSEDHRWLTGGRRRHVLHAAGRRWSSLSRRRPWLATLGRRGMRREDRLAKSCVVSCLVRPSARETGCRGARLFLLYMATQPGRGSPTVTARRHGRAEERAPRALERPADGGELGRIGGADVMHVRARGEVWARRARGGRYWLRRGR